MGDPSLIGALIVAGYFKSPNDIRALLADVDVDERGALIAGLSGFVASFITNQAIALGQDPWSFMVQLLGCFNTTDPGEV